jgi:hypothetical protein
MPLLHLTAFYKNVLQELLLRDAGEECSRCRNPATRSHHAITGGDRDGRATVTRTAALLPIGDGLLPLWGTIFSSLLAYTMEADAKQEEGGKRAGRRKSRGFHEETLDGRIGAINLCLQTLWEAEGRGMSTSGILVFFCNLLSIHAAHCSRVWQSDISRKSVDGSEYKKRE